MNTHEQWNDFIAAYRLSRPQSKPTPDAVQPIRCALPNGLCLTLRLERENERREVDSLIRDAFWQEENRARLGGLGADEHYLAHTLRDSPEFIPELNLVAELDGRIAAHILYSVTYILKPSGDRHPTVIFGPLAVLPPYQKQGIGGALLRHSLRLAARFGYGSVLIYGHETYYPRFGFKEAKDFAVTTDKGENFPAFMALELRKGDLTGVTGSYHCSPLFDVDLEKARAFDAEFPPI
jgi:predicted N-acetyltransferase YhbS